MSAHPRTPARVSGAETGRKNRSAGPTTVQLVAMYFAANPEEELTTSDVLGKFAMGNSPSAVRSSLRGWSNNGWLRSKVGGGAGKQTVYSAGPKLLARIGRVE